MFSPVCQDLAIDCRPHEQYQQSPWLDAVANLYTTVDVKFGDPDRGLHHPRGSTLKNPGGKLQPLPGPLVKPV
jgi:hypothetical protein